MVAVANVPLLENRIVNALQAFKKPCNRAYKYYMNVL